MGTAPVTATSPSPVPAARKSLKYIKDSVEFYQHQVDGIREMAMINSFILADEMGLGKSLQALTVAAIDFEKGWATKLLVVAPAGLTGNWRDEIEEHTNFKAMVLLGPPTKRRALLEEFREGEHHVLICGYEQVKAHLEALNELRFDIVIMDEAHMVKNPKAKRSKAAHALVAGRFFMLTGSPMLNHVNDLWSLLYRIDPGAFPKYWTFLHRYCVFGGYKDKQIIGTKNQEELTDKLQSRMIRRLKRDVLDLPEKQRITIKVDLHPRQQSLYDEAKDEMQITIPGNPDPMEIENALTKFLRLKQIAGTTATIEGYEDHSSKLDHVMGMIEEICTEAPQEHVVIFTQFRGVQAALAERLYSMQCPVYELHGDVESSTRSDVVKEWANDTPGVMIAMLQVAGVGLNMTAASKAIFLDKLWVPKLNEQAEDRIHRIGASTTQPVQIYEIIARNTVEHRIETILKRKSALFGKVVDPSDWKRKLVEALQEEDDL
jgi:SNF2 family DNA or RNA helicase